MVLTLPVRLYMLTAACTRCRKFYVKLSRKFFIKLLIKAKKILVINPKIRLNIIMNKIFGSLVSVVKSVIV